MGKKGRSILKKPSRPKPAKGVQKSFDCPICEEINTVSVNLRKANEHPLIMCSNSNCILFTNPVAMKYPPSKLAMLDPIDIFTDFKDDPEKYLGDVIDHQTIQPVQAPVQKAPVKRNIKAVSTPVTPKSIEQAPVSEEIVMSDDVLEFD